MKANKKNIRRVELSLKPTKYHGNKEMGFEICAHTRCTPTLQKYSYNDTRNRYI